MLICLELYCYCMCCKGKSNRYKLNSDLQAVTTINFVARGLISHLIGHCTNDHSFQIHMVNAGLVHFKTGVIFFFFDGREDFSMVILVCVRRKAAWCSHHLSGEKIHDTSS